MNTLAIDVGGTKFTVAAFREGHMVRRETRATDRDGGRDWMLRQIVEIGRSWQQDMSFDNCGIGFGGPVDFDHQLIALSTHVGGWSNFDLPKFIADELSIPAVIDNDANVGALGEYVHGAGQRCDPLFYMTVSTGIGGGIVSHGQVLRGADCVAGEIGHTPLPCDGPQCLCGARGCLERYCSGLWLEKDNGQSAKVLMDDPAFVERYVIHLAMGLKIVIMMLNPARIVIGGGISKAGDKLFVPLRRELSRQITAWSRARVDVVPSSLGDNNVLFGALALTLDMPAKNR